MKKPQSVRVSPQVYEIRWDNQTCVQLKAFGQLAPDQGILFADPKVSLGNRQETLVHESLHAMWKQSRLCMEIPDEGDDSEGEKIIRDLSPRILAWVQDNPELVDYIRERS